MVMVWAMSVGAKRFVTNFNWLTLGTNLFYSTLIMMAKFESRNWRQN